METHSEEETVKQVITLQQIASLLHRLELEPFWTVVHMETSLMCIHIEDCQAPQIERSVVVSQDLSCRAYWKGSQMHPQANLVAIPESIEDMRTLHTLLESIRSIETTLRDEKEHRTTATMMLMLSLLEDLISDDLLSGEKLEVLRFIQEQLQLLMQETTAFGYSAEHVVFARLVYTISPHAYAYMQ